MSKDKHNNEQYDELIKKIGLFSPTYNLLLHIGKWRKLVPDERRKIIIAEALNRCMCSKRFMIVGYLITERRVCLILDRKKTKLKKGLRLLDKCVEKEVKHYLKNHAHRQHGGFKSQKDQQFILGDLFKYCILYNENLIKAYHWQKS